MAIANLIARGIGFNPGSTKFIVTHGFLPSKVVVSTSRPGGSGWVRWEKRRKKSTSEALFEEIEATLKREIYGEEKTQSTGKKAGSKRRKAPIVTQTIETTLLELVDLAQENQDLQQRVERLVKAYKLEKDYRRLKAIEEDDMEVLQVI